MHCQRTLPYRITKVNRFDFYEQKQLTRHHHNLKEELNIYKNRLKKCIDIVFPEFNSLFHSKYGIVYMSVLKTFSSANAIANADIRSIRKCFEFKGRGGRISLSAEQLKTAARVSIGIPSVAEEIQIRHLVCQIELLEVQLFVVISTENLVIVDTKFGVDSQKKRKYVIFFLTYIEKKCIIVL